MVLRKGKGQEAKSKPVMWTTAQTLLAEYHAELAADDTYLNRTFILNGFVASTQKQGDSKAVVVVVPHLNEFGLYSERVVCVFESRSEAARLQAGGWVELVGTCKGLTDEVGHVVKMENCRLATKEEKASAKARLLQ